MRKNKTSFNIVIFFAALGAIANASTALSAPAKPEQTTYSAAPSTSPQLTPIVESWTPSLILTHDRAPKSKATSTYTVVVQFCVDVYGKVSDPEIISAKPSNHFNDAALNSIRLWRFFPAIKNGHPVRRCGIRQKMLLPRSLPPAAVTTTSGTLGPSPVWKLQVHHLHVVPVRRFEPHYPQRAMDNGVQGCTMVGFNLSPKGRPTDLHVISHYPSSIFDVAAIRTISKWRFRITSDTGKPVGMRNVAQEIIFETEYNPRVVATLRWLCLQPPARTLIAETAPNSLGGHTLVTPYGQWADLVTVRPYPGKRLVNGWVKLNFCVNSHGNVVGTKIANASPAGLYDDAAAAALSTWNFSARKIDGKAVGTCGLSYKIHIIAETTLEHGPLPVARMPIAVNLRGLGDSYHRKGAAIMRFCVEADGSTSHVEVVSSKPNANYGKLAVGVIRNSKYWPRQSHGNPVRTCNVKQTVEFHFGHQGLIWGNMGVDYNEVPYAVYPGG